MSRSENSVGRHLPRAGPVLVMCLCAVFFASAHASATTIDDFSDKDFSLEVDCGTTPDCVTQTSVSGVLGGDRDVVLEFIEDGGVLGATASLTTSYQEVAFYNNDTNVLSELTFTYDGMENFDLTEDGAAFGVEILLTKSDHDASVEVTVTSTAGSSSASTGLADSDDPVSVVLLFSDFSVLSGSGGDFKDVDAISFLFTGEDALDLGIDEFRQYVPEPLTMLGLFLGLGSVGAYIRRRRMS